MPAPKEIVLSVHFLAVAPLESAGGSSAFAAEAERRMIAETLAQNNMPRKQDDPLSGLIACHYGGVATKQARSVEFCTCPTLTLILGAF